MDRHAGSARGYRKDRSDRLLNFTADAEDLEITVCDFWPRWHEKTGKLLGTGHTVVYENNKVMHRRPRSTPYSRDDPDTNTWSPWKTIQLPDEARFGNAGAMLTPSAP